MKTPKLKWNDAIGEGTVQFPEDFDKEHFVTRLDALEDWLYELQKKQLQVRHALEDCLYELQKKHDDIFEEEK